MEEAHYVHFTNEDRQTVDNFRTLLWEMDLHKRLLDQDGGLCILLANMTTELDDLERYMVDKFDEE